MDITYDRFSLMSRLFQILGLRRQKGGSDQHLVDTINGLRETIKARNMAYHALTLANKELKDAKERMEDYNRTLEQKVDERTAELMKAREEADGP